MKAPAQSIQSTQQARQKHQKQRWRLLLWYARLVGFLMALCGVALTCGPTNPGEQQYLASAQRAQADLRYDLALARYTAASGMASHDPLPYCLAGEVRMLQQEWSAASADYARCATLDPLNADSWRRLGDAHAAQGNASSANAAWSHAAQLGDQTAPRRLAQAAEQQGNVAAAISFWQRLPKHDTQALAHLGMLALWQGNSPLAQTDFEAASTTRNANANQLASQGFLLLPALLQQDANTQGQLGHAFLAANLPALALAPFQRAVTLAPHDGEAYAYLGWTALLLGQGAAARIDITRGLALAPNVSFAWFAAGELALAEQQPALAVARFQQGTVLDPNNALLWAEASRAALVLHDYTSALLLLSTASRVSNRPDEAIELLHVYIDYHLGFDDGTARRAAISAVTRWPDNEPLEFLLAQVYSMMNDVANAYYAALAAHVLDPTDPGPYLLLGAQAENEGNYVTAVLDLRTALALRPHGPFAAQAAMLLAPLQDIPV